MRIHIAKGKTSLNEFLKTVLPPVDYSKCSDRIRVNVQKVDSSFNIDKFVFHYARLKFKKTTSHYKREFRSAKQFCISNFYISELKSLCLPSQLSNKFRLLCILRVKLSKFIPKWSGILHQEMH